MDPTIQENSRLPVKIRQSRPNDLHFILESYISSTSGKFPSRYVEERTYRAALGPLLDKLLKVSQVLVACWDTDEDIIYGFVIYQKKERYTTIHYCFVKKSFRGFGIGKMLIEAACPKFGETLNYCTQLPAIPQKTEKISKYFDESNHYHLENVLTDYKLEFDPFALQEIFYDQHQGS